MDITQLHERYGEDFAQMCAIQLPLEDIAALSVETLLPYLKTRMDSTEYRWRRSVLNIMQGMVIEVMAAKGHIPREMAHETPIAVSRGADAPESVLGPLTDLPPNMPLGMTARIEDSAKVMGEILAELRADPGRAPSPEHVGRLRVRYLEARALYVLARFSAPAGEVDGFDQSPQGQATPGDPRESDESYMAKLRVTKSVRALLDQFGGAESLMAAPEQDLIPLCVQASEEMRRLALGQPPRPPEITLTVSPESVEANRASA
ncbi:MAG: hypothetical protein IPI58_07275 [Alphaproteobacteria bacterium]|nr:MAG: hypothetical protein IPI58_07275 [Alphaproteobacteria bacterium]